MLSQFGAKCSCNLGAMDLHMLKWPFLGVFFAHFLVFFVIFSLDGVRLRSWNLWTR